MSIFFINKSHCIKVIIAVLLSMFFITNTAFAETKEKTIKINVDANNCVTSLTPNSHNNCIAEFGAEKNPCKGKKDCVCSKKDKHIVWEFADSAKKQAYAINFPDGSPFTNCPLTNQNGAKIKCKVTADVTAAKQYYYSVKIEACPTSYDPIIIIDK